MEFQLARRSRHRPSGPWDHLAADALEEVREVALLQKGLLLAIGSHLMLLVAIFFFSEAWRVFVGSVYLFAALVGSGSALLFYISRQGPLIGIGLALVALLPVVGAIILLWTNGKAVGELKQYGGPVGWLGVPWRHIPPS
jgi:hypothetical protein